MKNCTWISILKFHLAFMRVLNNVISDHFGTAVVLLPFVCLYGEESKMHKRRWNFLKYEIVLLSPWEFNKSFLVAGAFMITSWYEKKFNCKWVHKQDWKSFRLKRVFGNLKEPVESYLGLKDSKKPLEKPQGIP